MIFLKNNRITVEKLIKLDYELSDNRDDSRGGSDDSGDGSKCHLLSKVTS